MRGKCVRCWGQTLLHRLSDRRKKMNSLNEVPDSRKRLEYEEKHVRIHVDVCLEEGREGPYTRHPCRIPDAASSSFICRKRFPPGRILLLLPDFGVRSVGRSARAFANANAVRHKINSRESVDKEKWGVCLVPTACSGVRAARGREMERLGSEVE